MRLRRLDLTRYGRFTDFSLDFGEAGPAGRDFHVVYGPNEAGKSTLLNAYLDLLFGIERQSAYNFLHDYRVMRVAALVELGGTALDLARVKKAADSLLDGGGRPLPETVLTGVLGSIDRSSYQTMFSLDDDSLQSGGESILESRGDLGRLLFSAASGLSEISRRIDDMNAQADAFHRPGGQKTGLKQLKDRLAQIKAEQSDRDTPARRYAELSDERDRSRAAYEAARQERDCTRLEHDHSQRLLNALPIRAALAELRARLEPLKDLPEPPEDWAAEVQVLMREKSAAEAEIKSASEEIERLAGELEGIVVDEPLLALQDPIERLADDEGRYRSAVDISAREAERGQVGEQIAEAARRLAPPDGADPRALVLPAGTVGALNELIESRSGIVAGQNAARRELDAARDRAEQAGKALEALGAAPDVSGLIAVVARLREAQHDRSIAALDRRRSEIAAGIADALAALRPWQGDAEALGALPMPGPGQIERWKEELAVAREEQAAQSRRLAELAEERARLAATIESVTQATGAVGDDQLRAARAARDAAWAAHRSLVDRAAPPDIEGLRATADAFEATLAEHDRLADLRERQTAEVARLRQDAEALARTAASTARVESRAKAAERRLAAVASDMAGVLGPLGLPCPMEPADLERWLERRAALLGRRAELRAAESELRAAETSRDDARGRLIEALAETGAAAEGSLSLGRLLDVAQSVLDQASAQAAAVAAAKRSLEQDELALEDRRRSYEAAEQADQAWSGAWRSLIAGCWLGGDGTERSVAEVREIIRVLSELPAKIDQQADLARRIEAMAADRARFVEAVRGIADAAGLDFAEDEALEAAAELRRRQGEAQRLAALRESKQGDLERATARRRAAEAVLAKIDARRTQMAGLLGVDSLAELATALDQAKEKASLTRQIDGRARELVDSLGQGSFAEAESMIQGTAGDAAAVEALRAEAADLSSRLADQDQHVSQLFHDAMSADEKLQAVGGDAAVARLEEERRTLLLEIRELSEGYLRLKVGIAAAEQALRVYRDRHRSSMLRQAGEAFRTITRGRFSDLTTAPGKDSEILVGVQSGGASLVASDMSRGTRFQLYLALRIAGYREFAAQHEALPFVADDIMETFDDDRSAEAFQLLAGMAERGQVIYLTHHPHLCRIAREVCGESVRLHELPPPPTDGAGGLGA